MLAQTKDMNAYVTTIYNNMLYNELKQVYSDQIVSELYGVLKQIIMTYLILLVTRTTAFLIKVFLKEMNIRPQDR